MRPSIHVHHGNLRVELHREDLLFSDEDIVGDSLGHVHDQLQVEATDVGAHEVSVQDLAERDPVKRQVLILRALEVLLENHVNRLYAKERHRVEQSEVILSNHFHLSCVLCVQENLKDLLDFLVCEYVELVVLDKLIVHDSLDFSGHSQTREFRGQTEPSTLGDKTPGS